MLLETFSSPEVKALDVAAKIIVVPLGSFEQHGPHLPLTTDTDLVTAVARAVERLRPELLLCLPTLWLGHSTHHLAFPGTMSIRQLPYVQVIIEMARSIVSMGGRTIFFLNGHGGNDLPVRVALRELKSEFADVTMTVASYWSLAAESIRGIRESGLGGLGHACELETSLMLHLHPERVRMNLAKRDGPDYPDALRRTDMQHARPMYLVEEFSELSNSGTVGFPEMANASKGKKFFEGIVEEVVRFVDEAAAW
jgi:creatinine amidohydrolase